MSRLLTILVFTLTLSCHSGNSNRGDQEFIKKPTDPETLKRLKEQKGFIATEKDLEEYEDLTKGLTDSIIKNPPLELGNQISDFIKKKFDNKFPEQRVIVYHPKVVSRTDRGKGWSEHRAYIDTTTYSADLLLWNDNDTVNWQLIFKDQYILLYDFEKK